MVSSPCVEREKEEKEGRLQLLHLHLQPRAGKSRKEKPGLTGPGKKKKKKQAGGVLHPCFESRGRKNLKSGGRGFRVVRKEIKEKVQVCLE